jgi:hypothetical protein
MSSSVVSETPWKSTHLQGIAPEAKGVGPFHGDHYQTVFSPASADFMPTPLSPTEDADPRSSVAPYDVTKGPAGTSSVCFDVTNGRGPTLTCAPSGTAPQTLDAVATIEAFVRATTIPVGASASAKAKAWASAFAMLHPHTQTAWGHATGFQQKLYDPRSLFAPLGRVVQFWVNKVVEEPNRARATANVRILDRLYTTHTFTFVFERNAVFDSFLNLYPAMDWRIQGIFPEDILFG